jgi:hypothetical protein
MLQVFNYFQTFLKSFPHFFLFLSEISKENEMRADEVRAEIKSFFETNFSHRRNVKKMRKNIFFSGTGSN